MQYLQYTNNFEFNFEFELVTSNNVIHAIERFCVIHKVPLVVLITNILFTLTLSISKLNFELY